MGLRPTPLLCGREWVWGLGFVPNSRLWTPVRGLASVLKSAPSPFQKRRSTIVIMPSSAASDIRREGEQDGHEEETGRERTGTEVMLMI